MWTLYYKICNKCATILFFSITFSQTHDICGCSSIYTSAFFTAEGRWATAMRVTPSFFSEAMISSCISSLSAEVASSRMMTRGRWAMARAMRIRCFCPPEISAEFSAIGVSIPRGRLFISSDIRAMSAASRKFDSPRPNNTLTDMLLSLEKTGFPALFFCQIF